MGSQPTETETMASQPMETPSLLANKRGSAGSQSLPLLSLAGGRPSSGKARSRRARIADAEAEDIDNWREEPLEGQAGAPTLRRRNTRRLTEPARTHADRSPIGMGKRNSLFPERDGLSTGGDDDVVGVIMRKLDSKRRPVQVHKCESDNNVCRKPSRKTVGPTAESCADADTPCSRKESSSSDDSLCAVAEEDEEEDEEEDDVDLDEVWSFQSVEFLACWAIFAIAIVLLTVDLYREGLGVKNRWVPSVADSLSSCASFRNYRPTRKLSERRIRNRGRTKSLYSVSSPRNSWLQSVAIVVLNLCSKFGSATVGSLLLGETPVIVKGPRHMILWLTVFALIQICPGDIVFNMLRESCALRLILRVGCAVYKLRKFNFVVLCQSFSAFYVLLVQAVVIDGNSIAQKTCTSMMTFRLGFEMPAGQAGRVRLFMSELKSEIQAVLRRTAPLAALTVAARCSLPSGGLTLYVRVLTLSFFLYRCDAHGAALQCWEEKPWNDLPEAMCTTSRAVAALWRASKSSMKQKHLIRGKTL